MGRAVCGTENATQDSGTKYNLISDPHSIARVDIQSCEEATLDYYKENSQIGRLDVIANNRSQSAA
jgi:hypothetical protein